MLTMDFEELRNILKQEQKQKLAKLEPDFYENVRTYLDGLREEQKTASGREAQFLADELETASDRLQRIFKLRIGKIVNLASLSIMGEIGGIRHDIDMMTPIERDIYDSVLGAVRQGWNAVEQVIAGELVAPVTPVTSVAQVRNVESAPPLPEEKAAEHDEDAGGLEGVETVNIGAPEGYTIVRVLKNIPTFVGTDSHHYTLAKNDVVTLPDLHAKVLCKRRAVLPVEINAG